MKVKVSPLLHVLLAATANAFAPFSVSRPFSTALHQASSRVTDKAKVMDKLDEIAHKLRLQVYDVDTGVYGFESKDPKYGIETIRTFLHMDEFNLDAIGLELTEMAHGGLDHRGLVLVSDILVDDEQHRKIQVGDTIVGVFVGEHFKGSTTGLDYDETVDVLDRAKKYACDLGGSTISIELNRLVKRASVKVVVEDGSSQATLIEGKAGDNLRTLLMHHHAKLYDPKQHRLDQPNLTGDCGGEGICATCMVKILQGMEHLNKVGPQESTILKNRPESWRAACKTVIGADNHSDEVLRIRLQPWAVTEEDEESRLSP